MAQAGNAFSDARMFYSYQFVNVAMLGLMLLDTLDGCALFVLSEF